MCVCPAHVVSSGIVFRGGLNGVGQEAEDGAGPQQDGEATKQLTTELDPLWSGGGRGESVWTIPQQKLCSPGVGQPLVVRERSAVSHVVKQRRTMQPQREPVDLTWTMSV